MPSPSVPVTVCPRAVCSAWQYPLCVTMSLRASLSYLPPWPRTLSLLLLLSCRSGPQHMVSDPPPAHSSCSDSGTMPWTAPAKQTPSLGSGLTLIRGPVTHLPLAIEPKEGIAPAPPPTTLQTIFCPTPTTILSFKISSWIEKNKYWYHIYFPTSLWLTPGLHLKSQALKAYFLCVCSWRDGSLKYSEWSVGGEGGGSGAEEKRQRGRAGGFEYLTASCQI